MLAMRAQELATLASGEQHLERFKDELQEAFNTRLMVLESDPALEPGVG